MRPRRKLTWFVFAVCILAVLEGLGWVTWHALRLERSEREARAAASFQESIRLALWRMESEVTPIMAAESSRPYFHYLSFYPAERAYTRMWQQVKPNEVLVPSPLLESSGPYIQLNFQIEPDGHITSPQAPTGNQRDLAEAQYVESEFIVLASKRLDELSLMVQSGRNDQRFAGPGIQLGDATKPSEPPQIRLQAEAASQTGSPSQAGQIQSQQEDDFSFRQKAAQTAQSLNNTESQRRNRAPGAPGFNDKQAPETPNEVAKLDSSSGKARDTELPVPASAAVPPAPVANKPAGVPTPAPSYARKEVAPFDAKSESPEAGRTLLKDYQPAGPAFDQVNIEQGPFAGLWRSHPESGAAELLLQRTVKINGTPTVQGIWMDWPRLRERLLATIHDLLPAATLNPVLDGSNDAVGQRLAAIPVSLLPGTVPTIQAAIFTPTHVTLLVTWIAVMGAIAAIGIVLRTSMELSERRGRFVSAVTHELRTPLTTFCLYTEMLSDGMVKDEESRRHYLSTLKSESGRLSRIVQNVLDYAGIGGVGRRSAGPVTPMRVTDLLERLHPAMEQCATRAGMTLVFDTAQAADAVVAADPQTVERILLNLVENAGKYAGEAPDRRVHIRAAISGSNVLLSVRDHGPGVPRSERNRIFHAFHRARRDAQGPKSGLGLGLALARELARELGGRLTLTESKNDGAEFCLALPFATLTKH